MAFHDKSIPRALLDLFPNIGLDESLLQAHRCIILSFFSLIVYIKSLFYSFFYLMFSSFYPFSFFSLTCSSSLSLSPPRLLSFFLCNIYSHTTSPPHYIYLLILLFFIYSYLLFVLIFMYFFHLIFFQLCGSFRKIGESFSKITPKILGSIL